jgi:hypothetical protein
MKTQSRIELVNEMTGLSFECTTAEINSGECIAATGEQLLDTFGIPLGGIGTYIAILLSLVVLFRIFALLALRIKTAYL